jgi:leucyl/phenylalanyl-tRNA---protein transferase
MTRLIWLTERDDPEWFPPPALALKEPEGLLAAGGDLSPQRLLAAYSRGIFPWYSQQQPILWWSPDPRMVLFPQQFKRSRSLAKTIRNGPFHTRLDQDFATVIRSCAAPRRSGAGTWLNESMMDAYRQLHALGHAHSVETWRGEELVGGLYGVHLSGVFFGESMFSRERDASKVALARLVEECARRGIQLIDCQVASEHLLSLGATEIPRAQFLRHLQAWARPAPAKWAQIA